MFDLKKNLNAGLLLVRLGVGGSMIVHGLPKLLNQEKWAQLGSQMQLIGIDFLPEFFGFMAGFAEAVGGLFFLIGLLTRTSSAMLAFTMLIAMLSHIARGDGFGPSSHAMELGFVFLGFILTGPGQYSVDAYWCRRSQSCKI